MGRRTKVVAYLADRRFNRIDMLGIYVFAWMLADGRGWVALGILLGGSMVSAALEEAKTRTPETGDGHE